MQPDRKWQRPRPPAREFPADTDPAGAIPDDARVELIFERSQVLSGSVGGQSVRLDLNVPAHDGAAVGTIGGQPVSATWKNEDNTVVYPDVSSDFTGSFAGQPVELHGIFHLEPGYFFDHAAITGHVGTQVLDATVETASGGLGSTKTIAADGQLGGTDFTIYAAIDSSLTTAKIRGSVAGSAIRIDAERTRRPDGGQTRLTGCYQGPLELLVLVAGALLHHGLGMV